jgi:hypothetical protein
MKLMTYKITLKLVRSFTIGFTIMSPKWNGFCVEVSLACFTLTLWSRGKSLFAMQNYWKG